VHRLEYDYGYDPRRISCATSLADLKGVDSDKTIVHICMPADDHASALRAATDVGFRRIIVEKPCAANTADVDEMQRIVDRTGASVAVINRDCLIPNPAKEPAWPRGSRNDIGSTEEQSKARDTEDS
jgi:hypothetical protein